MWTQFYNWNASHKYLLSVQCTGTVWKAYHIPTVHFLIHVYDTISKAEITHNQWWLINHTYLLVSGWIVTRSQTYHFKIYPCGCCIGIVILWLVIVWSRSWFIPKYKNNMSANICRVWQFWHVHQKLNLSPERLEEHCSLLSNYGKWKTPVIYLFTYFYIYSYFYIFLSHTVPLVII
jgi:hypothetical protein